VSYTASHAWNTSIKFNLPGGCLPGSLTIVTDGITIFDDAGLLKTASGTLGTIDYANGILTLNSGSMSNSEAVTYTPAAQFFARRKARRSRSRRSRAASPTSAP
jgi:hypothetical protein